MKEFVKLNVESSFIALFYMNFDSAYIQFWLSKTKEFISEKVWSIIKIFKGIEYMSYVLSFNSFAKVT